jgi:flavin reductase (DIM6/NTAB) family NADH-FMN oxidoreductase RutF
MLRSIIAHRSPRAGPSTTKETNVKTSIGAKTLIYPAPVLVVGSYDAEGRPNLMTAAWGGVACSNPPCVSVSLRAATASHGNIMARKAFTISLPDETHVAQADYVGTVSGKDHDKFAETGLTAVRSDLIDAPYVDEFPLVLECKVTAIHELGLHTQFIGEVVDAKIDEAVLHDGHVDLAKLRPILWSMDPSSYFGIGELVGKAWTIGKTIADRQEGSDA